MRRFFIFLITLTLALGLYSCSSRSKDVEIGIQLNTYEIEGIPYTDVTFITDIDNYEEEILIGSYMGEGSVLESFENHSFFNSNSLVGCQVYYAGGGDNVFAYLEDGFLFVKHIEFILGNEDFDSEIVEEKIIVTKNIPTNSTIKIIGND